MKKTTNKLFDKELRRALKELAQQQNEQMLRQSEESVTLSKEEERALIDRISKRILAEYKAKRKAKRSSRSKNVPR